MRHRQGWLCVCPLHAAARRTTHRLSSQARARRHYASRRRSQIDARSLCRARLSSAGPIVRGEKLPCGNQPRTAKACPFSRVVMGSPRWRARSHMRRPARRSELATRRLPFGRMTTEAARRSAAIDAPASVSSAGAVPACFGWAGIRASATAISAEQVTRRSREPSGIAYGNRQLSFSLETPQRTSPVVATAVCAEGSSSVLDGFANDKACAVFAANFEHGALLDLSHERFTGHKDHPARSVDLCGVTFATWRAKNVGAVSMAVNASIMRTWRPSLCANDDKTSDPGSLRLRAEVAASHSHAGYFFRKDSCRRDLARTLAPAASPHVLDRRQAADARGR